MPLAISVIGEGKNYRSKSFMIVLLKERDIKDQLLISVTK